MADDNEEFWAEERARAAAERGRLADPSACGTCRTRVEAGQQVEHDECAQRATLLQAPDHPAYELTTGLTEQELAALPARFHVPVYMDTCTPKAWVCAVCWGDGWCTGWPCATAQQHGAQVFTADHVAEIEQEKQAHQLEQARAIAVELENENARLKAQVWGLERPAIEAKRNEIRQSCTELASQAEQDRDHEGAFNVQCDLREREEQWTREDEEAGRG